MSNRYLDLLERTVWTFVQAALAVWIATPADLFGPTALKVAGVAGLIAAVKCVLAFNIGAGTTAATLPAGPDTDKGLTTVELLLVLTLVGVVLLLLLAVGVL